MKKAKILAVFGILLAMGITACNNGNNSEQGSKAGDVTSQEQQQSAQESQSAGGESQTSSEHKHSYGEWTRVVEPTCTEKGSEERVCECGDKQTRSVNALGHDWGEWAVKTASTCTTDGVEERACKREGCNATEERAVKADHKYGEPVTVAASGDGVEYTKEECSAQDCGAKRLVINQSKVTYASGSSRKSGTPEGYTKLTSNGHSMSFKFNYTHFAIGQLYLFGRMDGYSTDSNRAAGLYYQNNPNVEIKVNGAVVDVSAQKETKYSDIFGDEVIATEMDSPSNYLSNEGYFPIGEIVLQEGINEVIYKRVQTLNMLIKDFVFVIKDSEHTHTAATQWSSDETGHWHACTAVGCPTGKADAVVAHTFEEVAAESEAATCAKEGKKVEKCSVCDFKKETVLPKLAHTLGDAHDIVAATCQATGSQKKTCSVCGEVVTEVLPKLDHNFGDAVVNNAAGEGYVATTGHNCSVCNTGALRWSARNFDATLSATDLDLTHDGDKSVRFASGKVENKSGAAAVGSHIVYNVKVDAAVEKAGLSFKIKNTNGASGKAPVFGMVAGDSSVGAIDNGDGTFTTTTKRYGLRVNDVEYFLGDDNYGDKSGVTGWFEWPVEFPLKAGINKIDVFAYAGYRADLYEFQVNGLPKIESSHTHNGADAWLTDESNHWHKCTAEGCPIADGIYEKAEHTFGEKYDEVPATCTAKGSYKQKCTVCNYEKTVETDKIDHTWVGGDVTVDGAKGSQTLTCSACGETKTIKGGIYSTCKWSEALSNGAALSSGKFASGTTYEFTFFNVPADGTYVFTLNLKGSKDNGSKVLNGSGQGFEVKANGVAATFLGNQKTYAEFFGEDQEVWVDVAFAEVNLKAGTNVITIKATTGYYRISANTDGNVSLAPKA